MVNGDKAFVQAYNAQAAVDTESQIIVAAELTNQAADGPHMAPLVRAAEEVTGRRPQEVLADAGYWSEENVEMLTERGIACLIPPDKVRHGPWREQEPPPPPPSPGASLKEVMRWLLKLPENKERYRRREQSVEPVFGQIKEGRGLRQFLLRGQEKVRALWMLDWAAHNLMKLWRAGVRLAPG